MSFGRTSALMMALLPLLVVGLSGCRHKVPPPAPQISTAPPLPPSSMTQLPAVPPMPAPSQPQVGPPGSDEKAQEAPPPPVRKLRHKKRPAATADTTTAAASPLPGAGQPAAANPAPAAVAPAPAPTPSLGQLSAGSGADSHVRAAMSEQIHAQEVRLSKIKHPLSDEDQAVTQQIQAFLAKARQAVADNDLDGAQTLTTKAKVLLDELIRS